MFAYKAFENNLNEPEEFDEETFCCKIDQICETSDPLTLNNNNNDKATSYNGFKFFETPFDLYNNYYKGAICTLIEILGDVIYNTNEHYGITNKFKIIKILEPHEYMEQFKNIEFYIGKSGDKYYFTTNDDLSNHKFLYKDQLIDDNTIIISTNDQTVINRSDDLPAIVRANGDLEWISNGLRHRDFDKPAIEYANGNKMWYKYGLTHRDLDRPASESVDGRRVWYKENKMHRDDDKPAYMSSYGNMTWYKEGKQYRNGNKPDHIRVVGYDTICLPNGIYTSKTK